MASIGVNVVGHVTSEKGTGEALRGSVRALAAAEIPHCVVDFPDPDSTNLSEPVIGTSETLQYPVNLIHLNADALPSLVRARGRECLDGRYNIGVWMWELPDFPEAFHGSFEYLDEVWAASNFCLDAISRVSPIPCTRIPLALPAEGLETTNVGRSHFGLPEASFVFLFMFDVHSVLARKNPAGVIEAFRRAFPVQEDVRLVLKIAHGDAGVRKGLQDLAGDSRVVIIDAVLPKAEVNSLIGCCDCYVSLHRSEGFGLTIAEAMALGKPVIATAYSGNVDFMNPDNSLMVGYELVMLTEDHGPYPRGSVWAEPNSQHASGLLRRIYEDPELGRRLGHRAQRDIMRYLSPSAVGALVAQRLALVFRPGWLRGR